MLDLFSTLAPAASTASSVTSAGVKPASSATSTPTRPSRIRRPLISANSCAAAGPWDSCSHSRCSRVGEVGPARRVGRSVAPTEAGTAKAAATANAMSILFMVPSGAIFPQWGSCNRAIERR